MFSGWKKDIPQAAFGSPQIIHLSGFDPKNYNHIAANTTMTLNDSVTVTIEGSVGPNSRFTLNDSTQLIIKGNVAENVVFKLNDLASLVFHQRPPQSTINQIRSEISTTISMPGGFSNHAAVPSASSHSEFNMGDFFGGMFSGNSFMDGSKVSMGTTIINGQVMPPGFSFSDGSFSNFSVGDIGAQVRAEAAAARRQAALDHAAVQRQAALEHAAAQREHAAAQREHAAIQRQHAAEQRRLAYIHSQQALQDAADQRWQASVQKKLEQQQADIMRMQAQQAAAASSGSSAGFIGNLLRKAFGDSAAPNQVYNQPYNHAPAAAAAAAAEPVAKPPIPPSAPVKPAEQPACSASYIPVPSAHADMKDEDFIASLLPKVRQFIERIQILETNKQTIADRIEALNLSADEKDAFEKFEDPISNEYIKIPLDLNAQYYDLGTLLSMKFKDPQTSEAYTPEDVQHGQRLINDLDDAIRQLQATRAKNKVAPEAVDAPMPEAPRGPSM